MNQIRFQNFVLVDGRLYMEVDVNYDEGINDATYGAMEKWGMFWEEIKPGEVIECIKRGETISFTFDELVKVVKGFGTYPITEEEL